ncbi:hypothetical protein FKP32DRAFT_1604137 [Trametes sanguinea]|nr:hypothetical protein FKP32DRAFT_1604137 [Trametes sanguinea]
MAATSNTSDVSNRLLTVDLLVEGAPSDRIKEIDAIGNNDVRPWTVAAQGLQTRRLRKGQSRAQLVQEVHLGTPSSVPLFGVSPTYDWWNNALQYSPQHSFQQQWFPPATFGQPMQQHTLPTGSSPYSLYGEAGALRPYTPGQAYPWQNTPGHLQQPWNTAAREEALLTPTPVRVAKRRPALTFNPPRALMKAYGMQIRCAITKTMPWLVQRSATGEMMQLPIVYRQECSYTIRESISESSEAVRERSLSYYSMDCSLSDPEPGEGSLTASHERCASPPSSTSTIVGKNNVHDRPSSLLAVVDASPSAQRDVVITHERDVAVTPQGSEGRDDVDDVLETIHEPAIESVVAALGSARAGPPDNHVTTRDSPSSLRATVDAPPLVQSSVITTPEDLGGRDDADDLSEAIYEVTTETVAHAASDSERAGLRDMPVISANSALSAGHATGTFQDGSRDVTHGAHDRQGDLDSPASFATSEVPQNPPATTVQIQRPCPGRLTVNICIPDSAARDLGSFLDVAIHVHGRSGAIVVELQ